MSDDFGTISVGRGERQREIEETRQRYRQHRETLMGLVADAPTDELANEYKRLAGEIDARIGKLDELDRGGAGRGTHAGMRPLVTTNIPDTDLAEPRSRLPLIIIIALVTLGAIAALIWYASSDRKSDDGVVVEDTSATIAPTKTTSETGTVVPVESVLSVSPTAHDFGVIRRGTRATRQFEVTNRSDAHVTISLPRSTCRCLFYEYRAIIPPKEKESITVTIDGARAMPGEVRETIKVTTKADPVGVTFDVIATIQ